MPSDPLLRRAISAMMGEGVHQIRTKHVIRKTKYWDCRRRVLCSIDACISAAVNGVSAGFDHLRRMLAKLLPTQPVTVPIKPEVITFDEPEATQG